MQRYHQFNIQIKMIMKPWVAIVALINGMIGGVILVLPVLALNTGSLLSLIIILVSGFFSFYSCFLYIQHLSNQSDSDKAIYYHFRSSKPITIFYNITIFVNLVLILMSYFLLIVQQCNGLTSTSKYLNPILNAVFLFGLVMFLKYIRFGAHLLGYGVISIAIYCIFLIWILASAPTGPAKMPYFGSGSARTAAAMAQAFSIQQFFIPVLKELPIIETKNFVKLTLIVYTIGGIIYIFIAMVGSFGILNRNLIPNSNSADNIEGYFYNYQWQVKFIEAIYLVHLYSAFGWFILIAKKRLFCVFHMIWKTKNSKSGQFFTIPQIVFVLTTLCIAVILSFEGISFQTVIIFNGSVVGFFFIYLIPAVLHFICLYIKRPKSIYSFTFAKKYISNKQNNQIEKECELSQRNHSFTIKSNVNESFLDSQLTQNAKNAMERKQVSVIPPKSQVNEAIVNEAIVNETITEQKENNRKKSDFSFSVNEQQNKQLLLAGADVSIDLSANEEVNMSISKIDYACECKRRQGVKKVLDLFSIFGMVAFGLYIMVMGILSIAQKKTQ